MLTHMVSYIRPDLQEYALSLVFASTILMWRPEIARHDGSIDGAHYLAQRDGGGIACQDVSTTNASLGAH
jgi:hypothetical protein